MTAVAAMAVAGAVVVVAMAVSVTVVVAAVAKADTVDLVYQMLMVELFVLVAIFVVSG